MHCPLGVLVLAARSIMFFMKGVWLSIKPIEFQQLILKDKILGEGGGGGEISFVFRFIHGHEMGSFEWWSHPLGAGSLQDIGI